MPLADLDGRGVDRHGTGWIRPPIFGLGDTISWVFPIIWVVKSSLRPPDRLLHPPTMESGDRTAAAAAINYE